MKSIESTGKTVKDAINQGVQTLGCDSSDVEIEILEMGSPGLFGMFGKLARVKLTLKESHDDFNIDMPVMSLDQPSKKRAAGKKPAREKESAPAGKAEADKADAPAAKERPRRSKPRARKDDVRELSTQSTPAPVAVEDVPFVETPSDALSETAKSAAQFLTGLTDRMGIPTTLKISDSEEQLRMQLFGQNMSVLIGRRGETLDALQYLTSLTVNRGREDYLRVSLDTENYRHKREEALRKLAVRMASRARKTGKRVALEPMNPYERRILHAALQSDPDVTTHSEGEEPYRRVIITLK